MILAADVGGTKTLVGVFEPAGDRPRPVQVVQVSGFSTRDHRDLESVIDAFFAATGVDVKHVQAAAFGVAGPVIGNTAELTNVPWRIDAQSIAKTMGISRVAVLNDLQAMAHAVPVLEASELHVLQEGEAIAGGNMALVAAGTGLGEAVLHNVGGHFIPAPTEAGQSDFAARTDREIVLLKSLRERFGRARVEDVVSGPGLVNVHRVTHDGPCAALDGTRPYSISAAISAAALDRQCAGCVEALEMFVEAYTAEAGNLTLRAVATGGLFIGGGIAQKILPALTDGRFLHVFHAKAPFEAMMRKVPVKVILNADAALIGAAVYGATL